MKSRLLFFLGIIVFLLTSCDWFVVTPIVNDTPNAPTQLILVSVSTTSATLQWSDNSENETGFQVQWGESDTSFSGSLHVASDSTSISIGNLTSGTTYFFRVRAVNFDEYSQFSNIVEATTEDTLLSIPDAPTSLTGGSVTSTSVVLTWQDNSDNETNFELQWGTVPGTFSGSQSLAANLETFTLSTLDPQTTYYFRIRSVNGDGNSDFSSVLTITSDAAPATTLVAPSLLATGTISDTSIALTWQDNSADETAFEIQWGTTSGVYIASVNTNANIETYTIGSLSEGTTYYFRVRAIKNSEYSSFSNIASASTTSSSPGVLVAPDSLAVGTTSTTSISLTWQDNSSDETGFEVQWGTTTSFGNTQTISANLEAYTVTSLTENTLYYFRVRALRNSDQSDFSSTVSGSTTSSASTAPEAPTNLTATALSENSVQLNWQDNSSDEEGFDIYRSIDSLDFEDFVYLGSVGENVETYTDDDSTLPPATNIFYLISAYKGSEISDFSDLVYAVTHSIAYVPAPTNVAASDGTNAYEIFITWTWSEGADSYKVYGSDSADGIFILLGETTNAYASVAATDETHYFYKVSAVDWYGEESDRSAADEGWAITPTILLESDFEESSDFDSWYPWPGEEFYGYYNLDVWWTTPGANGTLGCLRLDGGYIDSIYYGHTYYTYLSSGSYPTNFKISVKAGNNYNEGAEICGSDTSDIKNFWIYFSNDGYIKLYSSGRTEVVRYYSSNTWYTLEVRNIDWSNNTYDFYVNGELEVSSMPFANSSSSNMYFLNIWNDESGCDFYFDEILMF